MKLPGLRNNFFWLNSFFISKQIFLLGIICLSGCSTGMIKRYQVAEAIKKPEPWNLSKLEISGKDWKISGCWDCFVMVQFNSGENWETSVRAGKLSYVRWRHIRVSPDGRCLYIPYFHVKFLDPEYYELIELDIVNRREKHKKVSEKLAREFGWSK